MNDLYLIINVHIRVDGRLGQWWTQNYFRGQGHLLLASRDAIEIDIFFQLQFHLFSICSNQVVLVRLN